MAVYFVADQKEIAEIKHQEDIWFLVERNYPVNPDLLNLQAISSLSRLFFGDESRVLNEIVKILSDETKIYRISDDLPEKIASYERAEMNLYARLWREDKYWKDRGYEGMGIWSDLYFLHDLCRIALKEQKNLYVSDEME